MSAPEKDNTLFDRIDRVILAVTRWISYGSGICLFIIMVLAFCNVVTSKLMSRAIPNATDIVAYLNVPICFLSVAYVQLERGHTNIMLLQRHFHPVPAKIVRIVSHLLGAGVCGIIGWRAIIQTGKWFASHQTASSNISSIKIWPYACILAFGYLLLALCFLWSVVREFAGRPLQQPPLPGEEADE